ncbi:MAG: pantoate--beta-alanine ligase [Candidatus Kapaibacterium sp.]
MASLPRIDEASVVHRPLITGGNPMLVLQTTADIHAWRAERRAENRSVGFVPTMGYLHDGHMALVDRARTGNDAVLASIFVNPAQFAAHEDLSAYPRDFVRDCSMLQDHGCDAVFAPSVETMYPSGFATSIHVDGVTTDFEGAVRPTHFDGVVLVVTRLLCLATPQRMYLGQKDLQQTAVLRRLVADLGMDTDVVIVPTVRDADGLAKSSRNVYLESTERQQALVLSRSLRRVCTEVAGGTTSADALLVAAMSVMQEEPEVVPDYVAIVDAESMRPIADVAGHPAAACIIAARVGRTRLIDNCMVHVSM